MEYKYNKNITLGYDADGNRVRSRVHANTQAEFNRIVYDRIKQFESVNNHAKITLGTYIELWSATNLSNRASNTVEYYQTAFTKLEPIKSKTLKDISRTDIQMIISNNWDKPRTCKKIKQVVKRLLDSAVIDGYIASNVAAGIEIPKQIKVNSDGRRALTIAEKDKILNAKLPPKEHIFLMLEYYLGCRPQELRALQKSDFNLSKKELTITKAVSCTYGTAQIKSTKNHETRVLPLPSAIIPEISSYLAELDSNYLFTMSDGNLMTKSSFVKFSARIIKATGIEGITLYTFRHNVGTNLYYKCMEDHSISFKMAAYLMGHSEQMFLQTYSHLDFSRESIENIFD